MEPYRIIIENKKEYDHMMNTLCELGFYFLGEYDSSIKQIIFNFDSDIISWCTNICESGSCHSPNKCSYSKIESQTVLDVLLEFFEYERDSFLCRLELNRSTYEKNLSIQKKQILKAN